MLPAASRLRRRPDFSAALRHGRRAGTSRLVVHAHVTASAVPSAGPMGTASARAGFVVGRVVGAAVVRNRVRRRLRHLVAARLPSLPPGTRLVVRALPAAAGASSTELAGDLDRALRKALQGAAT